MNEHCLIALAASSNAQEAFLHIHAHHYLQWTGQQTDQALQKDWRRTLTLAFASPLRDSPGTHNVQTHTRITNSLYRECTDDNAHVA
jgi:hypothetical protein